MKIVVAHPGKQYVNGMLEALVEKSWLQKFYSQFVSNLLPGGSLLGPKVKTLKKYYYPKIKSEHLSHRLVPYAIERAKGKSGASGVSFVEAFADYDQWVADEIEKVDYDICLAYENSNLLTFTSVKAAGKVTVLDLAQVHHNVVVSSLAPVWPADQIAEEKATINSYKEKALAVTDYVITLSHFARETMISEGWDEGRVYWVNLGIDTSVFKPKPEAVAQNDAQPFTFVYVGTLMKRKGMADLLNAWGKICGDIDARLLLVGPMGDADELVEEFQDLVEYHPFMHHEELVKVYQNADVYVLPSYLDSWAQTVIEAMACGAASIVSESTGAKDAVKKGGGWVIPTGNEQALLAQMMYCYQNQEEVRAVGRKAAEIAADYTWGHYHRQVQDVFTSIAEKEGIAL